MTKQRKAVALVSGGLDSLLAVRVMQEQGIHVEGINFFTGFCVEGHTHAIRKKDKDKEKRNNALWCAEQLGIKLHIIDIVEEYKDIVFNPKHGYGKNLNPCLDCKIFMVKKAKDWMLEHDFDFVITGEVIGQRPMSQRRDTMPVIQREAEINDLLVRPLCGKNLPATKPETEGWIQRQGLYDFSGRTRKPQMALAKQFNFENYASPAGGCCFLTDAQYSVKLVDLWDSRGKREYEMDDIMLLKIGRHIRPAKHFKIIVAREEGESNYLKGYKKQFITLETVSCPGPLALIDGDPKPEDIQLAARIIGRYSKDRLADEIEVSIRQPDQSQEIIKVQPLRVDDFPTSWIL